MGKEVIKTIVSFFSVVLFGSIVVNQMTGSQNPWDHVMVFVMMVVLWAVVFGKDEGFD